jgi:hypothetical protein
MFDVSLLLTRNKQQFYSLKQESIAVTQRPRPADIYLRFLQLAEAVRGLPSLPALEPLEERILEIIAHARLKQERLSVKDLMGKRELGSPAMLHGRLKSMREKGWILLAETEDARRKQLELSKAALTHFDKLSKCILKAAKQAA